MVPNDGATPRASQPPIQLQGVGAGNSGNLNATVSDDIYLQGSVLDLRSLASPAKFDTRGSGLLKIDGCHFHRIRRAVYGRERCNSIIVVYNPELFIPPQILI